MGAQGLLSIQPGGVGAGQQGQRNYPDDYASVVDFDGVSGIPQLSLETVGLLLVLVSAIFSAPLHKNRAHRLVSIRSDAVLPIQL